MPGLVVLAEQLGRVLAPSVVIDAAWPRASRSARPGSSVSRPRPHPLRSPSPSSQRSGISARHDATVAGGRVSGTKIAVPHAASVDAYAVAATLDGAPALVFVEAGADGIEVVPEHALDPTARSARLILDDVEADSVFSGDVIAHAFAVGAVATAAEAVGAASAALDLAVALREGARAVRPRRSARSRPCSTSSPTRTSLRETAWSAALYAAAALDEDAPDAAEAATIAKAYASRAARTVVQHALQVLGGIGFTWEHDLHLFLRRVLACEQRFGDALFHERQLAAALAARAEERQAATTGRSVR